MMNVVCGNEVGCGEPTCISSPEHELFTFLALKDFVRFSCLANVLHAVILNVQHVNIPLIACCLSRLGNYSVECFVVFLNDSKIYNFCDYASFIQLLPLTAMILVLFVHFG